MEVGSQGNSAFEICSVCRAYPIAATLSVQAGLGATARTFSDPLLAMDEAPEIAANNIAAKMAPRANREIPRVA